ncbi:cysteine--tRNA ligase [Mesorhizobium sp. CAU 1741]|uniref:cysteine--tRNA ligase n=1 Tax=Mesorhizobium sp. CAU 1741 TaxID=3140366 RepID=UPI00325C1634
MSETVDQLRFYNTLTRTKEAFTPIDPHNVRMYVCGPTVYDFAHIGNARPVIVFDVLYRLLRHVYGEKHVTYARNITDVDDKINARALRDYGAGISAGTLSLNEAIRKVTEKTASQFHADVKALGCLEPTFEPRATEHIGGMVAMAQSLIDRGNAYVATGAEGREVLFDTSSMPDYGKLSNRRLDEQQAGARIEVKEYKKNPGDFVLWKESASDQPGWAAHFHFEGQGVDIFGRPGWHIECSVMSRHHLGEVFDIHGGGLDLIFPHHENELAQSCCAHGTDVMANVWMHNGFLQVEGRKMSKSEGNFVTINELLSTEKFGGRKWPGEVLRLAMLMTHYREPIDFSVRKLEEASGKLQKWKQFAADRTTSPKSIEVSERFFQLLGDDLNTVEAFSYLDSLVNNKKPRESDHFAVAEIIEKIGFSAPRSSFSDASESVKNVIDVLSGKTVGNIENIVNSAVLRPLLKSGQLRPHARTLAAIIALQDWANRFVPENLGRAPEFDREVQRVKSLIAPVSDAEEDHLRARIDARLAFIRDKNWAEADRIRDELLAQGVQLKDGKDPQTGDRVTTWEVVR